MVKINKHPVRYKLKGRTLVRRECEGKLVWTVIPFLSLFHPRSHGHPHNSRDPLSPQIKPCYRETLANVPVNFP